MVSELPVSRQQNVVVAPLLFDRRGAVRWVTGAWLADGTYIDEFELKRGRKRPAQPSLPEVECVVTDPRVYGGIILDHYGHFLFETLSRYWFLKENLGRRTVWHSSLPSLKSWQSEVFGMLNLSVDHSMFIQRPTRFSELSVPTPGAELWTSLHAAQVAALGVFSLGDPMAGRRIWLSRAQLKRGAIVGELELEAILRKAGWEIMCPEALRVQEQLAGMAGAEVIAGFDGSAFHTLMLARSVAAKVVIVPRGGATRISRTFEVIATAKKMNQVIVQAQLTWLEKHGRGAIFVLENPSQLADELISQ